MDYWYLMLGAIMSLVGMVFHGVVGGKIYIGNVDKSDMEPLTKSLSLVSWHIFTIFLFISAITLAYIAYRPDFAIAAYPIFGLTFSAPFCLFFLTLETTGP